MKLRVAVCVSLWLAAQGCGHSGRDFATSGSAGSAGEGGKNSAGGVGGNGSALGGDAGEAGAVGQGGTTAGAAGADSGLAGMAGEAAEAGAGGTSAGAGGTHSAGSGGAGGSSAGSGGTAGAGPRLGVLQTDLLYPIGLWVRQSKVYITEARATNTAYGGTDRLRVYDPIAGTYTILTNNITNGQAVVVASTGKIYLGSYQGSIPGDNGSISVVDPGTHIESPLVNLPIAISDMYIDAQDNIFVIGPSDTANAKNIYKLPVNNYTSPVVLQTGLGRVFSLTVNAGKVYFSSLSYGIEWFTGTAVPQNFAVGGNYGLTASSTKLFSCDISANTVSGVDLATGKVVTPVANNLKEPTNARYDSSTNVLYFLESGTNANQYKDGRLTAITAP